MEEERVGRSQEDVGPGEKPQRINIGLIAGAAIAIIAVVIGIQFCQTKKFQPVGKGTVAPSFAFKNLEDKMVSLEDQRGKVVFLNIWATWCDPCREEMPSMERLYQKLKGRPFEILAVSVDSDPTPVKPFKDEYKLTFPILLDTRRKITRLYRATGVPETFIIDAKGVIAEKVIGARNWSHKENVEMLENLVEEAEGLRSAAGDGPAPTNEGPPAK